MHDLALVTSPPDDVEKEGWAPAAAGSGALFALGGAAAFALALAAVTVAEQVWALQHPEPDVALLSSTVPDAVTGGLVVLVVAFLYASLVAAPLGAVLGVVNGAVARHVRGHQRRAVAATAVVVGTLTGLLLPRALVPGGELSWINLAFGLIAAVCAGAHLRREQRRRVRPATG